MFEDLKEKIFGKGKKSQLSKAESQTKEENKSKGNGGLTSSFTNLIIVFLVGVLLVIVGSIFEGGKSSSGKTNGKGALAVDNNLSESKSGEDNNIYSAVDEGYKESLETELTGILEEIQGVGKVKAVINFEKGVERVPVFNEDSSNSETNETDTNGGQRKITQNNDGSNVVMESNEGNQKPFITKEYNPTISGILIVAEGADDRATELRVKQAAAKLFGLEEEKVVVYPMKK